MPRTRKKPERRIPGKTIIDFTKPEIREMLFARIDRAFLIPPVKKVTLHFATDNEIDLPTGMAASLVIEHLLEKTDEESN